MLRASSSSSSAISQSPPSSPSRLPQKGRRYLPTTKGSSYPNSGAFCYCLLIGSFLLIWLLSQSPTVSSFRSSSIVSSPMDSAALLEEISQAAASGVKELDWSGRGLTSLPSAIGSLTQLEKLNLAGNKLSSLPPELAQCVSLRILFFLDNAFTEIPSVVGKLPALFMLSFKSNRLVSIPEDALPPTLAWLILTDNRLTTLPSSLGRLAHLRKLMLASNLLTALPDLSGLASLELIRLSDNRLTSWPLQLFALPKLAWMAMAGNNFEPLPRSQVPSVLDKAVSSLQFSDVAMGEKLGEGTSGVVYVAQRLKQEGGGEEKGCSGGKKVAVKIFKDASSDGRPMDEVAASLSVTSHPNLINILGFVAEGKGGGVEAGYTKLATFSEFCSGMGVLGKPPSFTTVTRDVYPGGEPHLTLPQALALARGVASAAGHLHAAGLSHGDLYAHNILVDKGLLGVGGASKEKVGSLEALEAGVKLGDLGATFFYDRAGPSGKAVEQVEVRAWACLVEELLGLVVGGGGEEGGKTKDTLLRLTTGPCKGEDNPKERPLFAQIVQELKAL